MSRTHGLALFLGMLAACGGDDSSASGVDTGLPTTQKLSTLSDDEVKQACHRISDAAMLSLSRTALQRAGCLSTGVQAGLTITGSEVTVDVAKCQKAVDACASDASAMATEEATDDCDTATTADVNGCEATVGEWESCMNRLLSDMTQRLSELTCQNAEKLQSSGYEGEDPDPAKIPQCQSIMTKCPDAELGLPSTE